MSARLETCARSRRSLGMTLVELMISMVLGLIVVGGVVSVLLANKQSYHTNEALSQVQESARSAFELLARDIRQAGATGCDNTGRVANVLNTGTSWWDTWFGVAGYDGADSDPAVAFGMGVAQRVNGTDSIQLQGIQGTALYVEEHNPTSANLKINAKTTEFTTDDILIVCDFDHATIFQITHYNSNNVTVVHNKGKGVADPGNCSKGLGFPADCSSTNGNSYEFGPNSQVARFSAVDWYIGNNGRADEGGRSLYRRSLSGNPTEIVAGVTDMEIQYRLASGDDFVDAGTLGAGDWTNVNAVSITLTLDSADQRVSTDASVNSGRLRRSFTHFVTLRNRVP